MSGRSNRWELTGDGLEGLLSLLDDDRQRAAEQYEKLRSRLIRLFGWRGCTFPEELADETINRVARKLGEGVEIRAEDPYRYFAGVAHRVFLEVVRREKRERTALAEVRHLPPAEPVSEEKERRLGCLERCLATLSPANRQLILSFYQGEGSRRIANRKQVACLLGITVNALRIRAHRLRAQLEDCVSECLRQRV